VRTRILLGLAIAALYLLHQDVWFWRTARPLVFGFLPIGLAYHALYCLAASLMMWVLTRAAWPAHLEGSHSRREQVNSACGCGERAKRVEPRERGWGPASR
jgi:hypothetical protein